jgi:co-chaperonin GroES (HSP10)
LNNQCQQWNPEKGTMVPLEAQPRTPHVVAMGMKTKELNKNAHMYNVKCDNIVQYNDATVLTTSQAKLRFF